MDILETVLLILLVLVAVAMGVLVLLQQSKGADIGAAFGSGSGSTVFGSAGATSFLVKFTAILAIAYFIIAFGLSYTAKERAASLRGYDFEDVAETAPLGTPDASVDAQEVVEGELEGDDMPEFVLPEDVDQSGDAPADEVEETVEQDLPDL